MSRTKRRAKPLVRRRPPPVVIPPVPEFEKPFSFPVAKAVIASVMTLGIVHALLRPARPVSVMALLFFVAFAVLSARMAYVNGRDVAVRVRRWRSGDASRHPT